MAVHYQSGSSQNINKSTITQVGSTTRSDINAITPFNSNLKSDGNKATEGEDATTTLRTASANVTLISSNNGKVAINLGSGNTPVVGSVIRVAGAAYPFSRSYVVASVSGTTTAITNDNWADVNCTGIDPGTYGTWTVGSGLFDSPTQGQFIILGNTTEIAGQSNTALQGQQTIATNGVHKFEQYRSRVYTNNWLTFGGSGSFSPCQVTSSTVTFSADQAASGVPTVILQTGGSIWAADLEQPEGSGLRAPA